VGFGFNEYGGYHSCHNQYELDKLKMRIEEVDEKVKALESEASKFRTFRIDREYELMRSLGDKYRPPKGAEDWKKCDFTMIGDTLMCNKCHEAFFIEAEFFPPFCPSCFAEWIGDSDGK